MLTLANECDDNPANRKEANGVDYRQQEIRFYEAFYPTVVLGSNQNSTELIMKGFKDELMKENQKKDLKLVYRCDGQWYIYSSQNPIAIPKDMRDLKIDNRTCDPEDMDLFNDIQEKLR